MEFFRKLYDLLRHLNEDEKWRSMIEWIGGIHSLYGLLCLIVFCETGLVVLPFLPGDSLLFFIGAKSASNIGIEPLVIAPLLILAALLGDNLNYWLGRRLGPAVFKREGSRLLNKKHLVRAHEFYEKYGSKTVILARFVPIVRTFAPFVAGIGQMNYLRFLAFSVIGAVAWVSICVGAGYYFGQLEFVKKHFEVVVLGIVLVSVLPMVVEFLLARRARTLHATSTPNSDATPSTNDPRRDLDGFVARPLLLPPSGVPII